MLADGTFDGQGRARHRRGQRPRARFRARVRAPRAGVVVAGRRPEPLDETVGADRGPGREGAGAADRRPRPDQVDALVAAAVERFGRVDVLVNNAAGNFVVKAEDLSPNGWRAVVAIVLDGGFLCSRAAGGR